MILIYIYIFAFGLIIGSFLNALIWRLHSGESMLERSRCPDCHQIIRWHDNIPLFSYLILRGKCRMCGKHISIQYPLVELITGLLFLLSFIVVLENALLPSTFYLLLKTWFVISVMIIVFIYDLRWYLILDKVLLPAGVVLFLMQLVENWEIGNLLKIENWILEIIAIVIGYGFFALQYHVSEGRWIGYGDVKLGILMGLALASPARIIAAIFLAYVFGAMVGVGLIALGKKELSSKLPFGTFLSVATVVILLYGEQIINRYLQFAGF